MVGQFHQNGHALTRGNQRQPEWLALAQKIISAFNRNHLTRRMGLVFSAEEVPSKSALRGLLPHTVDITCTNKRTGKATLICSFAIDHFIALPRRLNDVPDSPYTSAQPRLFDFRTPRDCRVFFDIIKNNVLKEVYDETIATRRNMLDRRIVRDKIFIRSGRKATFKERVNKFLIRSVLGSNGNNIPEIEATPFVAARSPSAPMRGGSSSPAPNLQSSSPRPRA